jgi:phosphoenolpyruvate carboxykinase (ATP)
LKAILNGEIERSELRKDENFGFAVPVELSGVRSEVLDPGKSWKNVAAYDVAAASLVERFKQAKAKVK